VFGNCAKSSYCGCGTTLVALMKLLLGRKLFSDPPVHAASGSGWLLTQVWRFSSPPASVQ
jgi:hypothetical protein